MKKITVTLIVILMQTNMGLSKTLEAKGSKEAHPFQNHPSFLAITNLLKTFGTYSSNEKVQPVQKEMTEGQKKVEEAKARNRAILAAKKEIDKNISQLSPMDQLKVETAKLHKDWKEQIDTQRKIWKKEQEIFLGRLKEYKENTFVVPAKVEKIIETKVEEIGPEAYVVNQAFEVPIRDQEARPTCSAFAGIRQLEIILAQNEIKKDLSSQYLYWASKPDCQKSPCTKKGSWITAAFEHSKKQANPDIPLEYTCPYSNRNVTQNETQIPLGEKCNDGLVKVDQMETIESLAQIIEKLKANQTVIVGAKLTENFYVNHGLVTLEDSQKQNIGKKDDHALGHAFLAVGFHQLPEKLRLIEGLYCIIVANSWGAGWGVGGYSCLTENWLKKFRLNSRFMSVNKLVMKD